MNTKKEIEVYIPDAPEDGQYLYVDFYCDIRMENDGIGGYEYAGIRGFDDGHDYPVPQDEIKWNRGEWTEEQNESIKSWLEKNHETVTDELCKKYLEGVNEY